MISLAMLFGTAAAALAAVWLAARRRAKELSEWAVGSRSFGAVMVFVLFAGENFTTFTLLGGAGWAYDKGVAATYTWCYTPLACLVSYWYLPKIWRYAKAHRAVSQSDYLRLRYDSKTLGVLITLVGVVAMTPYLALQLKGLAIIAHEASRQQIPVGAGVIAGAALVAVYAVLGGLRGAALTSIVKDVAVVIVVLGVGVWLPYHLYGGPGPITRIVADQNPEHMVLGPDRGYGPAWFISTVLLCGLGAHMWPHLFASFFSARSEANLRRTLAAAPFYAVALATTLTIGFAALVALPPLGKGNEDLAFLRLVAAVLPDSVLGFVGAAGLLTALVPGAVLATTIATSLTRDGYANLRPEASESELARAAKWLLPIVVAVAAVFAFSGGQTIVGLLLAGYSIVAQAFPAVVGSVLPRNPFTLEGVVAGLVVGTALAIAAPFVGIDWRHCTAFLPEQLAEVNVGLVALTVNLLVATLVSLWTRKPRPTTAA
jgi:SSS family solute:Na+ symporter